MSMEAARVAATRLEPQAAPPDRRPLRWRGSGGRPGRAGTAGGAGASHAGSCGASAARHGGRRDRRGDETPRAAERRSRTASRARCGRRRRGGRAAAGRNRRHDALRHCASALRRAARRKRCSADFLDRRRRSFVTRIGYLGSRDLQQQRLTGIDAVGSCAATVVAEDRQQIDAASRRQNGRRGEQIADGKLLLQSLDGNAEIDGLDLRLVSAVSAARAASGSRPDISGNASRLRGVSINAARRFGRRRLF